MAKQPSQGGGWPDTMRAWEYNRATEGLDKALYLNEIAAPPPKSSLGANAVLVRVLHAALNPADYKLAELGLVTRALVGSGAHPGTDFSGRVVAAGRDAAARYQPGQLVFGRVEPPTKFGTLAQYVVVRSPEGIAPAPAGMGEDKMAELAGVGTVGLTALQTIQPYLPTERGRGVKVFINGGSGGTGTFGIQIAKALRCEVVTSCSTANVELCRRLGADEVIDYKTQSVTDVLKAKGQVFSLVVDNVGFSAPGQDEDLYRAANVFLREDGYFVQVGAGTDREQLVPAIRRAVVPGFLGGGKRRFRFAMAQNSHANLATIGDWMRAGKVTTVIDEVFSFEDAPKAYEKLKSGRAKGKIVVNCG